MSPIFNFHFIDGTSAAALILMAGGGGTFAVVRRNQRNARQPDPEAIELDVTHPVEGGATPGSAGDARVPENTVAAEDAGAAVQGGVALRVDDDEGAVGQGGAVQCGVALGVGDGEGGLEETGASDDARTLEVCGAVDDGTVLGVDAST